MAMNGPAATHGRQMMWYATAPRFANWR